MSHGRPGKLNICSEVCEAFFSHPFEAFYALLLKLLSKRINQLDQQDCHIQIIKSINPIPGPY